MAERPSFNDFITARVGPCWVIAKETPRLRDKYGPKGVFLTPKRHAALAEEYERATGRSCIDYNAPCKEIRDNALALYKSLNAILRDFPNPTLAPELHSLMEARSLLQRINVKLSDP